MSVSRETAAQYFGGDLTVIDRYVDTLSTSGIERGLIGPREVPRLWERHILNCVVVVPRVATGARVADVGSGAGLPGLVWAVARPDLHVTLIEPLLRRTTFLEEVVDSLALTNVGIVRGRAPDVGGSYDVVTSRAVADLGRLGAWCLPLVRPGGALLAFKGRAAEQEIALWTGDLRAHGARDIVVASYGDTLTSTTIVEVSR